MSLTPLIGPTAIPFITFFPAVLLVAWYGGFRAGALSTLISAVLAGYYFASPLGTLFILDPVNRITLLVFVAVGLGMALLSHAQRSEAARRRDAETAERRHRQRFETTLASIGDAVISTDAKGCIVFANPVAQSLVRWPEADMLGKHLDEVFHIVNEYTRATVDSPGARVLREGVIVGLANHTTLIARDGTEVQIDDSAAPIRMKTGQNYSL